MELLALVIFNLVLGFVFYIVISVKINEKLKDFQTQKLKKEIQAQTLQFYKESENYLALMDAKITALKNLLDRAEKLGIDFDKLEKNLQTSSKAQKEEISSISKPSKVTVKTQNSKELGAINLIQNTSEETFLSSVGKAFRNILGIEEPISSDIPKQTTPIPTLPKTTPKNKIDFSIGGNPFEEKETTIQNKNNTSEFYSLLSDKNPNIPKANDQAKISVQAALKEIPANASKVEKVIFLLKKGYTHSEISEELGLALPEIALIETIHIEKSKNFK